jgi:hypothetical protein
MATGRAAARHLRRIAGVALVVAALVPAGPARGQTHDPSQGPGGPILVVASPGDPFSRYYAEILRAEGLNEFAVTDATALSAASLAPYQVVLLAGGGALNDAQVGALDQWVRAGGNLVAFRPAANLAALLGLSDDDGDLSEGYLKVDTGQAAGAGVTGATMQFHGTADHRAAPGATTLATLYADAVTPTAFPAVTLRSVGGAGGQAAAFMYDLARSVVLTRQGNPAWVGQKRDLSTESIRPVDLFFGAAPADPQPDWLDRDKVAIPQADEQQRLLANLITLMNADRTPLPRFWYLPRGERAAVVMTGDDHFMDNTTGQFEAFKAASPAGCSVPDWQCVRATSYLLSGLPFSDAAARAYEQQGFELALHLNTECRDYTTPSLEANWQEQLAQFRAKWGVAAPRTLRTHCVTWSDWAGEPRAALRHGVRFDTNYYYAGEAWVQDRPGVFTGSGFPMRFADLDGSLIDVYQATTQMTDESGMDYPVHIAALLDGALGPQGYYGVFTVNMHTDFFPHEGATAIVEAAQARGVPIVSSVQMLTWLDGRNGSSFQDVGFDRGQLRFRIAPAAGARGLEAMVPARSASGPLLGLTADGAPVSTTPRSVKGVDYAVFPAAAATYAASYVAPAAPAGAAAERPGAGPGASQRIRASARGRIRLGVTCRRTARACRITVRLRHRGKVIARKRVRVAAGKRAVVTLKLPRRVRARLQRRGALRLTAVITGQRAGGKPVRRKLRVLAHDNPRSSARPAG